MLNDWRSLGCGSAYCGHCCARSGSSPSESLFGVDLERGPEGGARPVDVMESHTATHFCSHTTLASRAISGVLKVQSGACPGFAADCEALK